MTKKIYCIFAVLFLLSACSNQQPSKELCVIENCSEAVYKEGLCPDHYVESKNETSTEEVTTEEQTTEEPTTEEQTTEPPTTIAQVQIPDVVGVEVEAAKAIFTKKGLLPVVKEVYSDDIEKGLVVSTDPEIGKYVDEDSKVTINVSIGPQIVEAGNANISWYNIDPQNGEDKWEFDAPYIINGDLLLIDCYLTPAVSFKLQDKGFGSASLTDTFDKKVPLEIIDIKSVDWTAFFSDDKYELPSFEDDYEIKAGEEFPFAIKISLKQLDSEFPTYIATEIFIYYNELRENLTPSFTITW